jgi:uncharacterized membrane protein
MQWYYAVNLKQHGPIEEEELRSLVEEGRIGRDDLVWNRSFGKEWVRAATIPALFGATEGTRAAPSSGHAAWSEETEYRSEAPNRELMTDAREALAGSWGMAVGGVLVLFGVMAVTGLMNVIPILGSLVGFMISGPLSLGWARLFLVLSRREQASLGMLLDGFKRFGAAFLAAFLIGLLIMVWMLPGIAILVAAFLLGLQKAMGGGGESVGLMLWVTPVLIASSISAIIAQLRYSMTYFIMIDRPEASAWQAIRHSAQMMKGNKVKLFCMLCRFTGWALLSVLTLGIGFLWLAPYVMTSMACFYDELREEPDAG